MCLAVGKNGGVTVRSGNARPANPRGLEFPLRKPLHTRERCDFIQGREDSAGTFNISEQLLTLFLVLNKNY